MVPDVSVIAPVFRTRDTLAELVRRVGDACDNAGLTHEIWLVDDACPDESWPDIEQLAQDPHVHGLRLASNHGQHFAVLAGFAHARGTWLVSLDADLQDPPEVIPDLLCHPSAELVFAGRRGVYQGRRQMLTSAAYRLVMTRVTGLPRDSGMFFAMRRTALPSLLERGSARPSVMPMIGAAGLTTHTMPVERAVREHGASSYSMADRLHMGARMVLQSLRTRVRVQPHFDAMLRAAVAEVTP
ncbi:MAG: glycosyltransferase [Proteobacteria bacterium]|nr:glycosyltransferase [Pseudomonadota bacterium]